MLVDEQCGRVRHAVARSPLEKYYVRYFLIIVKRCITSATLINHIITYYLFDPKGSSFLVNFPKLRFDIAIRFFSCLERKGQKN